MNRQLLQPIERVPIARLVIERVVGLIKDGNLKPGDRLPSEKEMMQELGISRPSTREALRALEALDIIEIRPGQGSFVREIDFDAVVNENLLTLVVMSEELLEIIETRAVLEREVAEQAAVHATREDIEFLEEALDEAERAIERGESGFEFGWEFHRRLAQVAGNTVMAKLLSILYSMIKETEAKYDEYFDAKQELLGHRRLLKAVQAGDAERAVRTMVEHMNETRRIVEALLADTSDS